MKWLIKNKNAVTSYCGLLGAIVVAAFFAIQQYSISVPNYVTWVLGGLFALCFGIIGYLTGKKPEEIFNNMKGAKCIKAEQADTNEC